MIRILIFALFLAISTPAAANSPIRFIVPFTPGGTSDLMARILAEAITQETNERVVVENRPGGFIAVGVQHLLNQPLDGRSIIIAATGTLTHHHYSPGARNLTTQLSIISAIAETPMVMLVANNLPIRNLREFVEYTRINQQNMNYATLGQGGIMQMSADLLFRNTNINITPIAYQGSLPAVTDLAAGRIQMMFDPAPIGMQTHRNGNARAIAVTGRERSRFAPDIPTFLELGYDVEFTPWHAIWVAAGTPDSARQQTNQIIQRALQNPTAIRRYMDAGVERVLGTSIEESEALLRTAQNKWIRILEIK